VFGYFLTTPRYFEIPPLMFLSNVGHRLFRLSPGVTGVRLGSLLSPQHIPSEAKSFHSSIFKTLLFPVALQLMSFSFLLSLSSAPFLLPL